MEQLGELDKRIASEMSAKGEKLKELNIEARTILAFKVADTIIKNLLPIGLELAPPDSGPSKGANLNVIFSDRLIVQTIEDEAISENTSNQLVVCAIPVQHSLTKDRGVAIIFGLSATSTGAPGPYGVFSPAEANIQRSTSAKAELGEIKEDWAFEGENGERLRLELSYTRGLPIRSNTVTKAYSGKDPVFYRTYYADQNVVVQFSVPRDINTISGINYLLEIPALNLDTKSCELISITSQPSIIRCVSLPNHCALLGLQELEPAAYTKPYSVVQNTLAVDSPIQPSESSLLSKEQIVWLDRELPKQAQGICKVKTEDDKVLYIVEAINLSI